MNKMQILHLTLKKEWFDKILSGSKTVEYREVKHYWTKRLFQEDGRSKKYDLIEFRNGYSKNSKKVRVLFLGVKKDRMKESIGDFNKGEEVYNILLGDIIK